MGVFHFKQFISWFGYTRRERRASFILLILIVVIGGVRFTVPETHMDVRFIPVDTILADPVDPGTQVQDPVKPGSAGFTKTTKTRPLLNLNVCDSVSLELLPGIGPVLAGRIIKYRNLLGGFATVDQLAEVYGLPQETFNIIRDRVMADSADVIRIDVNQADFRQLIRLPYFDRYEVNAILKYRELEGRIENIDELFDNKLVAGEKRKKLLPYLEVIE